jgi:glycosyltransferase involved in cell wall biosynthesis
MIRVLEFADVINKADFIDTIVQHADPAAFEMSVCVRTEEHNIARPEFPAGTKYRLLPGNTRRDAVQTAWRLARLLKEWKIDILHAHHFEQAMVAWIATRIYRKTKLVIGRHYSDSIYRQPSGFKRRSLLIVEQIVNRAATRLIVPSKMIFEILTERQGIDAGKIDLVLYGFDPGKYAAVSDSAVAAARREFGMDGRFVVGNFSRLHEEKGQRYLLEAAALAQENIPDLLVLIVGEGAERASLEKQIGRLGLGDSVKLLGWRKDAMAIMSAADIVVQSTLQEAFSQVMCEALWLEKPLVITEVSGAEDIIEDGANGVIVPKANAASLSSAIEKLAADEDERKRLAANGRRFIEENLTIEKMIGKFEASFRKAMGG